MKNHRSAFRFHPQKKACLHPATTTQEREQKQNEEDDKADFGDHCSGTGDDAETEHARQDCDDKEDNSVV